MTERTSSGSPEPAEPEVIRTPPVVTDPPPPPPAPPPPPPPAATHMSKAARRLHGHMDGESPWVLGSAALLVALAAYWVGSFLLAFEHAPGLTAQERLFRMFVPGSLLWAIGALVAVALHEVGLRFDGAPAGSRPVRTELPRFLRAACLVSATAAGIDLLVELANFGHGIDRALAGIIGYFGVVVLSSAAARWAHSEDRGRLS